MIDDKLSYVKYPISENGLMVSTSIERQTLQYSVEMHFAVNINDF